MSSTPRLPAGLAGYDDAPALGFRYRLRSQLGCWSVPALVVLGFVAIAYGERPAGMAIGILLFVTAAVSLAWFIYSQQHRKHTVSCDGCGKTMSVVDAPTPRDELVGSIFDGYGCDFRTHDTSSFPGSDGHVYQISKDSDGVTQYVFRRLLQRWYACPECRRCFLAEPRIYDNVEVFTDERDAESFRTELAGTDNRDEEAPRQDEADPRREGSGEEGVGSRE